MKSIALGLVLAAACLAAASSCYKLSSGVLIELRPVYFHRDASSLTASERADLGCGDHCSNFLWTGISTPTRMVGHPEPTALIAEEDVSRVQIRELRPSSGPSARVAYWIRVQLTLSAASRLAALPDLHSLRGRRVLMVFVGHSALAPAELRGEVLQLELVWSDLAAPQLVRSLGLTMEQVDLQVEFVPTPERPA